MIPKIAYILGAGLGTRMGETGKRIPKPLWPIGRYSLLEIVLSQLKSWGIQDVYLNCHHQHLFMQRYVEQKNLSLNLIYEPELLGSGGCFANLKSLIGPERILACNADSFHFLEKKTLEHECGKYSGHVLFARKVSAQSGYNGLITDKEQTLIEIKPPPYANDYWTFSGLSLVDLSLVEGPVVPSGYFQSVVIPGSPNSKVSFSEGDFFDFGTIEDYLSQLTGLNETDKLFYHFSKLKLNPFDQVSQGFLKAPNFEMKTQDEQLSLEFQVLEESAKIVRNSLT